MDRKRKARSSLLTLREMLPRAAAKSFLDVKAEARDKRAGRQVQGVLAWRAFLPEEMHRNEPGHLGRR